MARIVQLAIHKKQYKDRAAVSNINGDDKLQQMISPKKVLAGVALLVVLCGTVFAKDILLRLDANNDEQQLPKNFRMFSELKISGSAQFSENELAAIKENIPTNKITIVDLRQEAHGFVNGVAVSWYGKRNWANVDKSKSDILLDEQEKLGDLLPDKAITLQKKIIKDKTSGEVIDSETESVAAQRVATEEEVVKSQGFNYLRITVTDHRRPSDDDVDYFTAFVRNSPPDMWLHFHCEAGKGRTTTFMVMYDMMKNAKTASLEEILARQSAAGGSDLNADNDGWRFSYGQERMLFIKDFYEYCRSNNDGYTSSWSSWIVARMSK